MNDVDNNAPGQSNSSANDGETDGTGPVYMSDPNSDAETGANYPKQRRRSSSGSRHDPKLHEVITDRKPAVEFVRPIEGTPAAEALAANKMIKVSKVTKGFHKIRGMKRPKMKNFNFMKKLNKTTKTKRKKKHFSKNFKGKVIDGVHELYTLTAGIMLGIRCTVGNAAYTATTVSVPDFTSVSNLAFPPDGSKDPPVPTPPHDLAHTFKFKSYAPKVFHRLREFFDISAAAYMDSVCGDYNFIEFISNSKSGQFFFYSHDGQYMLKTQTKEENKFMIRILPHYYQYLTENPNSLLVRILGMHRIKMYHLRRKVHFVVMTSVFDTPAQINTIYDLKGSLVGRSASQKERESGGVLKDNDLINDKCKLHFGSKKAAFMAQLEKDAMFLAKLNIMDYSLLVGIHDRKLRTRDTLAVPGGRDSSVSVTGGNAAAVAAAAASSVTSTGSDAGQPNGAALPHTHTHSNTPFRRGSTNPELAHALNTAGVSDTPGAPHTAMSPSGTLRKKKSTNLKPGAGEQSHGGNLGLENIRVDMNRSMSLEEDYHPPHSNANGHSHAVQHGATEGEYEEETEGEDEEEGEGEGEDEEEESEESEFEDVDAGDSDEEGGQTTAATVSNSTSPAMGERVVEDGVGALGKEGFKLSSLLRPSSFTAAPKTPKGGELGVVNRFNLADILRGDAPASSKAATKPPSASAPAQQTQTPSQSGAVNMAGRESSVSASTGEAVYTYGPGQARRHPWTSRRDEGINSRTPEGKRGDEIYYLGVIDILQQYNANKRMETIVKGITNDASQISSVSPEKYAQRFVRFMDANID